MGAAAPILSGAGIVSQFLGNQSAQKNANKAQAGQDALIQRQIAAFDARYKLAKEAQARGDFNPTKAIDQANALSLRDQGVAQNNSAGASRVMGYKPGDSAPIRDQDSIAERYRTQREVTNAGIASNLRSQEMNAFDPSIGSSLNAGIQTYGNREQNYLGQLAPVGGGLASLAQFFPQRVRQPNFAMYGRRDRIIG